MRRLLVMFAAVVGVAAASAAPAIAKAMPTSAPPGGARWYTFGTGHWRPHAGVDGSSGLVTESRLIEAPYDVTYGGAEMKANMLPTSNPEDITALSYEFKASVSGPSGGSPRLVMQFSDGGSAALLPLSWQAETWTEVNGLEGDEWEGSGGTCESLYAASWEEVKACHPSAEITAIYVVNDSGWLYPMSGETVVLDNLTVNSTVASGPGADS